MPNYRNEIPGGDISHVFIAPHTPFIVVHYRRPAAMSSPYKNSKRIEIDAIADFLNEATPIRPDELTPLITSEITLQIVQDAHSFQKGEFNIIDGRYVYDASFDRPEEIDQKPDLSEWAIYGEIYPEVRAFYRRLHPEDPKYIPDADLVSKDSMTLILGIATAEGVRGSDLSRFIRDAMSIEAARVREEAARVREEATRAREDFLAQKAKDWEAEAVLATERFGAASFSARIARERAGREEKERTTGIAL